MEIEIMKAIHRGFSRGRNRLFRNNVGLAIQGQDVSWTGHAAFVKKAKYIRFGLCVGSPDLVGWRTVKITPDMVGKDIAQFVAIEVKNKGGRATKDQQQFLAIADAMGACVGIARSLTDAKEILGSFDENYKLPLSRRFPNVEIDGTTGSPKRDRQKGEGFKEFCKDE